MGDAADSELLLRASERGSIADVLALLERGADVNARDFDFRAYTPLHFASTDNNVELARLLLNFGAAVDAVDDAGQTPLHVASLQDSPDVATLLTQRGADVNAAALDGKTALHKATVSANLTCVKRLLTAGANVHATEQKGQTPLHHARYGGDPEVARALLDAGANVHAQDNNGYTPLLICLERAAFLHEDPVVGVIRELASFGATWDELCDELVCNDKACDEAAALSVCLMHWAQERAHGITLTEFPVEVIKRGPQSIQAYIDMLATSLETELRRKVCVVGPSKAGKTSLIKSIATLTPSLEHPDDRTIGIDHVPLKFTEPPASGVEAVNTHIVTFWDFAGQDEYQVAHSLFFSRRTLYLVCIDLEAYITAYLQATIMANNAKQMRLLMDEFVTRTILRWVRVIFARQPDAEFVFVAAKHDSLDDNAVFARMLKDDLRARIQQIEGVVCEMRRDLKETTERDDDAIEHALSLHEYRKRVEARRAKPVRETTKPGRLFFASCQDSTRVAKVRQDIEQLIIASQQSFHMPDTYTRVLDAIVAMKQAAAQCNASGQVSRVFVQVDELLAQLSESLGVDTQLCRLILQTLHDLGDVLWYTDLDVAMFRTTVIIDPLLMIDFIRQVINHNYKAMMMPHNELKALPYWMNLDSEKQMTAMKQVLQKFHLVYPTVGEMTWDSDLIVPAYWKSKTCAAWLFGDDILRLDHHSRELGDEQVRTHWEFHFEHDFPDTLFDQLIVASHSPFVKFAAGPDWILFEDEGFAACRILVSRDVATLQRLLRFEAVLATAATDDQSDDLWACFDLLGEALERVLLGYTGLVVSRYVRDSDGNSFSFSSVRKMRLLRHARAWMPPPASWEAYKAHFSKLA